MQTRRHTLRTPDGCATIMRFNALVRNNVMMVWEVAFNALAIPVVHVSYE